MPDLPKLRLRVLFAQCALCCGGQVMAEPTLYKWLHTCVQVGGQPQGTTYRNVAVRYVVSESGAIVDAQVHRSSGDQAIDAQILRSVQTCTVRSKAADSATLSNEEVASLFVADKGFLVRGDQATIVDQRTCLPTPEDYPVFSRRDQEVGTATIRYTVDANGNLTDSVVAKSSGYRRLDAASMRLLSTCKFAAGRSVDGERTGGTFEIDYEWKLQ